MSNTEKTPVAGTLVKCGACAGKGRAWEGCQWASCYPCRGSGRVVLSAANARAMAARAADMAQQAGCEAAQDAYDDQGVQGVRDLFASYAVAGNYAGIRGIARYWSITGDDARADGVLSWLARRSVFWTAR